MAVHVIFFHHITGNRFGSRRSEEWGYVIHVLWKKNNLFETKKKKRLFTASYMYLNLTFFKCPNYLCKIQSINSCSESKCLFKMKNCKITHFWVSAAVVNMINFYLKKMHVDSHMTHIFFCIFRIPYRYFTPKGGQTIKS